MKNILSFKKYNPENEYKKKFRRDLNLENLRKTKAFSRILDLGFSEETSHQQELNNTIKFVRTSNKQSETGHSDVFYTIHPSGTVRRYNPIKSAETPEGDGNDIKKFPVPFKSGREYVKALNYLWQYLKRKESQKNYR
jgi:hypothetical protein